MASTGTTPSAEKSRFEDEDLDEDLWASPSKTTSKKSSHGAQSSISGFGSSESRHEETAFERDEARNEALKKELENVRKANTAIEGVIATLKKANENMGVRNARRLLPIQSLTAFFRASIKPLALRRAF